MITTQVTAYYRVFLFWIGLFSAFPLHSQEILVEGTAEKLIEDTKLMKQYEFETREWAISNALYNHFGSSVTTNYEKLTETTMQGRSVISHNDLRSNYFSSYPNGIWLREETEPLFSSYKDEKGNWWLHCKVKGWAREMNTKKVDFIARTLDGTDFITDESFQFISGERGFIYFRSSINGFLNIFFDDFNTVQRCLPYNNMTENMYPIKAHTDYLFFSREFSELSDNNYIVDEIELFTEKDLEYNQFYFLFSKDEIYTPLLVNEKEIENDYSTFKSMQRENFHKWLQMSRLLNPELQVEVIGVTIKGIQ